MQNKLPEEWIVKPFFEIVVNHDNVRVPLKAADRQKMKGEFPYYGASGIIDSVNDFLFDGEFLLISEDGANLVVRKYPIAFIAEGKFWVNNHAHILKAKDGITTNRFLELFFESFDISRFITGSAQPKLSQKKLNEIQIPLPPLPEQKRIVQKLDALFERIDKAIALLKENIAATKELMDAVLGEVFEKREGSLKLISEISNKIQYGYTGKKLEKSNYYYLRITDIQKRKVNWSKVPFSDVPLNEVEKYKLNKGDILFARTGATAGKSYLFNEEEEAVFASYLIRVVVDSNICLSEYLYLFFQSPQYWSEVGSKVSGAAQPNVNGKKLGTIKVPIPTVKEQQRIIKYLQNSFVKNDELIHSQQHKLQSLHDLKTSLLDQAFKGAL